LNLTNFQYLAHLKYYSTLVETYTMNQRLKLASSKTLGISKTWVLLPD